MKRLVLSLVCTVSLISSLLTAGTAAAAPAAFVHPGVSVGKSQLDTIKAKIAQNAEPWASAYRAMAASRYAALSWQAKPRATVECGPYSKPNLGCTDERDDAVAAYTHALLSYLKGDSQHADKAIQILDSWAKTVKEHTNSNARLQTGWAGSVFPRAAEIIRYTTTRWPAASITRFAKMLREVYLPLIINGSANTNGNWELSMMDASVNIAVFLDDRASFDKAVAKWRKRIPAYFYLSTDGRLPVPPPGGDKDTEAELVKYWHNQKTFVDGLSQESCRDFPHTQYGFAAATNAAETAWLQGVDLYREQSTRLTKALEFHADYLLGKAPPSWLCGGKLNVGVNPTWEVAYNHFHNRRGISLPLTKKLIDTKVRPAGVDHHMVWETLTSTS